MFISFMLNQRQKKKLGESDDSVGPSNQNTIQVPPEHRKLETQEVTEVFPSNKRWGVRHEPEDVIVDELKSKLRIGPKNEGQ